jgi:hypothetical protein
MCKACGPKGSIGDLIFTRSFTPISWTIRTLTHCSYSHVGVYFKDDTIIESDWDGVQLSPLSKYEDGWSSYKIVPVHAKIDTDIFVKSVFQHIGDKYDYPLLFGNFLRDMTFGAIPFTRWFDQSGKWICCEIIAYAAAEAGAKFDKPIFDIDQAYLYNFFEGDKT